jgi:hypothetical protein
MYDSFLPSHKFAYTKGVKETKDAIHALSKAHTFNPSRKKLRQNNRHLDRLVDEKLALVGRYNDDLERKYSEQRRKLISGGGIAKKPQVIRSKKSKNRS